MVDELMQLCPVQFIEGINENEEPIAPSEGRFWQPKDLKVAIPYKPTRTYTLNASEILGSPYELEVSKEHHVGVYTDRNNLPTETCVSKGKLVVPAGVPPNYWLLIHLEPVVVFQGQRYWIVLEDYPLKFAIGVAKNGEEVAKTCTKVGQPWVSFDTKIRYMLKFFGRVLPISM